MARRPDVYEFQRGETILMAIDVTTGTKASVSAITGNIRALADGEYEVAAAATVAASFDFTEREALGSVAEGWDAEIPGSESIDLDAGDYLADVRMVVSSKPYVTDPVIIRIKEPETLPAS